MGPSAVYGELELEGLGIILAGLELDLPYAVLDLGHLVLGSAGIPSYFVQPVVAVSGAVTDCIDGLILEAGREADDVAGDFCYVGSGIDRYGEGACAGQIEGEVVAGSVAYPLVGISAGLDDLELYVINSCINCISDAVQVVVAVDHGVGLETGGPRGAEDIGVVAGYSEDKVAGHRGGSAYNSQGHDHHKR